MLGFKRTDQIPYRMSMFADWIEVVKIPIDCLVFARKGRRKLMFEVRLEGTTACATCSLEFDAKKMGYIDRRESIEKFEEAAIQLGFSVGSADGEVHQKEAQIISEWMRRRVEINDHDGKTKVRLNKVIEAEVELFNLGKKRDIKDLAAALLRVATVAEKYDALELCIHVARADGVAEEKELVLLSTLAILLKVDEAKFRAMRDEHLTISMIGPGNAIDVDDLLGIKRGMSLDEKKMHLKNEFQKWNRLVTHSDPKKQQQARDMLDLIGEYRAGLANVQE